MQECGDTAQKAGCGAPSWCKIRIGRGQMQLCCSFPTTSTNPNHVFNTYPYVIKPNYYFLGGVGLVGKVVGILYQQEGQCHKSNLPSISPRDASTIMVFIPCHPLLPPIEAKCSSVVGRELTSFHTTSTNPNHVFNTFPYIIKPYYYFFGGVGLVGKVGRGRFL